MGNMELPLRELHLPDSISFWPLAIGWWIVLGFCLFLILLSIIVIRKINRPTMKKQAKKTLDNIEKTYLETDDALACLTEISAFLRRVMLSQKDFPDSAGLTGLAWLQLLDKPLKTHEFSQGVGQILLAGPYSPKVENQEVTKLIELCSRWVRAL